MKKLTAALLATTVALFAPFVGTNAGGQVWVCATPQNQPLDRAGYEALAWVQVGGIGEVGEMGTSTNILTYDTWDTDVVDKGIGMSNAGDPTIEVARNPVDAGQIILRNIPASQTLKGQKFAFKIVKNDPAVVGGTGTTFYTRGLVVGPARPMGRNEDFDLEVFTLGLVQREVVVDPVTGNPPVNTALPAITGTTTRTVSNGTWVGDATITYAYQWRRNGVAIVGATANTYNPSGADTGTWLSCAVTGLNGAGAATAVSAAVNIT